MKPPYLKALILRTERDDQGITVSRHSPRGRYQWPLPGRWAIPVPGELIHCRNGYHYTNLKYLGRWAHLASGAGITVVIHVVYPSKDRLPQRWGEPTKTCCRSLRLGREVARFTGTISQDGHHIRRIKREIRAKLGIA